MPAGIFQTYCAAQFVLHNCVLAVAMLNWSVAGVHGIAVSNADAGACKLRWYAAS